MLEVPSFQEQWEALAAESGADGDYRSLHTGFDFRVVLHLPQVVPSLVINVDGDFTAPSDNLVPSNQIDVAATTEGNRTAVSLRLKEPEHLDLFLQICRDIVPRVCREDSAEAGGRRMLRRFRTWRQCLKTTGGGGIDSKHCLGLYGELQTLGWLVESGVEPLTAVRAWTGPERAEQDFQLLGMALEVKSIMQSEPQRLYIDGGRQLDENYFEALIVVHHHVHRQKGSGETLPEAIDRLRSVASEDSSALEVLDDNLLAYGYLDTDRHRYADDGYGIRKTSYYRVQPGFPRLTENELPLGVGGLRYLIEATSCTPYEIDEETLRGWLADPPSIEILAGTTQNLESTQVEYKATAWRPVGPQHIDLPQEAQKKLEKTVVNNAVVKAVAGLLNTVGGELVLGMSDDGAVTGIERDLEWLDVNVDHYQLRLVQLLREKIDEMVTNYISIEFRAHDQGTTCHIRVRPSPQPRHAEDLSTPDRKRVFYQRAENGTYPVSTTDLPDWLADRFGLGRA